MSYVAGNRYTGKISSAQFVESGKKGTPGIEFSLSNPDHGTIQKTLWISANTAPKVKEFLLAIGVDELAFGVSDFYQRIGDYVAEKEVSWTTEEEIYKDKPRVVVGFLNAPGAGNKPVSANSVALLKSLFGVSSAEPEPQDSTPPWEGGDDE